MLKDAIDNIRGAVMICYPMGLPEWDLIRENLEDKEDLSGTSVRGRGRASSGARRDLPVQWVRYNDWALGRVNLLAGLSGT